MAATRPACYLEHLRQAVDQHSVSLGGANPWTAAPRIALERRGVSLAFLRKLFAEGSADKFTAPGQLVHGRNTSGPPDDWKSFDPGADPLSIRALTAASGRSLVETAIAVAEHAGGLARPRDSSGPNDEYFGPATHFVSYSWHDLHCGQLFDALTAWGDAGDNPKRLSKRRREGHNAHRSYFWIDIFAVAQNRTPPDDLLFENVIRSTDRTIAVMHPWASPKMLTRCWCLHELGVAIANEKELEVAMLPSEAASFRQAIRGNFGSILMTILASVDSENAVATRPEDKERIFGDIRETVGFKELNVRVVTLINEWLRRQHEAASGEEWEQRPAREQVEDFMGQLARIRDQVREMGLDPSTYDDNGILTVGGPDGIIIGCTDASAYVSSGNPPAAAEMSKRGRKRKAATGTAKSLP